MEGGGQPGLHGHNQSGQLPQLHRDLPHEVRKTPCKHVVWFKTKTFPKPYNAHSPGFILIIQARTCSVSVTLRHTFTLRNSSKCSCGPAPLNSLISFTAAKADTSASKQQAAYYLKKKTAWRSLFAIKYHLNCFLLPDFNEHRKI